MLNPIRPEKTRKGGGKKKKGERLYGVETGGYSTEKHKERQCTEGEKKQKDSGKGGIWLLRFRGEKTTNTCGKKDRRRERPDARKEKNIQRGHRHLTPGKTLGMGGLFRGGTGEKITKNQDVLQVNIKK